MSDCLKVLLVQLVAHNGFYALILAFPQLNVIEALRQYVEGSHLRDMVIFMEDSLEVGLLLVELFEYLDGLRITLLTSL